MSSPHGAAGSPGQASPYQDRLISHCRAAGQRAPNFQIVSDRRGGRTAWSCVVTVHVTGNPQPVSVQARYWYDGQYVNNAREDAAQRTLQMMGVIPSPPPPQSGQQTQHNNHNGQI